jgi:hypothetical protein
MSIRRHSIFETLLRPRSSGRKILSGLLLISPFLSSAGHAADRPAPPMNLDLLIELKDQPTVETVGKKTLKFEGVCRVFGAFLMKNQGLWGSGPFRSIKCVTSSDKASWSKRELGQRDWRLEISASGDTKTLTMFFRESDGSETKITTHTIEGSAGALAMMAKKNLNQLLAFHISQSLPFRSSIPVTGSSPDGIKISGPTGPLKLLTPPEDFSVFETSRVAGVWRSKPVGTARLQGESGGKVTWRIEGAGQRPLPPPGGYYFLQQISGREEVLRRSEQMVTDEVGNLLDALFGIGKAAYIGGRYGTPIGGQGVMKSAAMIGFFADLRSGLASGFKLNYDLIPQQQYIDQDGLVAFQWSRFQIGYSFLKPVNWGILNQIDATPRIGATSLKYDFVPAADTEFQALNFEMSRAPTIGLELGAEKNTSLARFRLWAFGSFSVGVLPVDKNHSTSSVRVGIDAYRDLFKLGRVSFAVLGFSAYETTRIKKTEATTDTTTGETNLSALTLKNAYVGGGATLTW